MPTRIREIESVKVCFISGNVQLHAYLPPATLIELNVCLLLCRLLSIKRTLWSSSLQSLLILFIFFVFLFLISRNLWLLLLFFYFYLLLFLNIHFILLLIFEQYKRFMAIKTVAFSHENIVGKW